MEDTPSKPAPSMFNQTNLRRTPRLTRHPRLDLERPVTWMGHIDHLTGPARIAATCACSESRAPEWHVGVGNPCRLSHIPERMEVLKSQPLALQHLHSGKNGAMEASWGQLSV